MKLDISITLIATCIDHQSYVQRTSFIEVYKQLQ